MSYSSKYLEKAVDEIAQLPGIGRKTALRLALHILKQDDMQTEALAHSLLDLKQKVTHCKNCGNISDTELCQICSNPHRNHALVCVVEDIRDVIAIENTEQYRGIYHVLGGVISPMDGVGPMDLNIDPLVKKVEEGKVEEIIFGISTTMEGETTTFYISRKLGNTSIQQSVIARGIAVGDQLEYADELTLGRSILNRVPYETKNQNL